jgi:signal transduction histidine kinase/ligand-binding sensor domain-containing protein/DNA-binding response OmpR family regulator
MPFLSRSFLGLVLLATVTPLVDAHVLPAIPEEPRFDRLTVDDGLPNNTIWDITRGASGFLWLGTVNGLVQFNGYEVTTFRPVPGDTTSISGRNVVALEQGPRGRLWIGSIDGGLDYLDMRTGRFHRPGAAPGSALDQVLHSVVDIAVGPDSTIWVASPNAGLWRYDAQRDRVERARAADGTPAASDSLTEVIAAADGTVWVGTENRGIANYDPDKEIWRWYELPIADDLPTAGAVEDILQDRSGRIWVCTRRGFFGWYPDLGEFRRLGEDQGAIWSSYMLDIDEDIDGTIWIGAQTGLLRFDPERYEFRSFVHDPSHSEPLPPGPLLCVHCDESGAVWLGGWQTGISVLDPWRNNFTLLTHVPGDPGSIDRNTVTCALEDSRGTLWVGTGNQGGWDRGGLNRRPFGEHSFQRVRFPIEGEPWSVQCLTETLDGTLWIGTVRGLWIVPPGAEEARRPRVGEPLDSLVTTLSVFALGTDLDGHILVGTRSDGLYHVNRSTGAITHYRHDPDDPHSLSGNQIIELHRDRMGRVWVGTAASGLNLHRPRTDDFQRFRDAEKGLVMVTAMVDAPHGQLYAATSAGLFLVGPDSGINAVRDAGGDLVGETITSLQVDDAGELWAHTSRGLEHLDATGQAQLYDRCSGVPPGGLYLESCRTRDGTLYFGSQRGLVVVEPRQIRTNPFDMPSMISGLQINGQRWPIDPEAEVGRATVFPYVERVELDHDQNDLGFTFATLCLIRPEHNRYRYRLDGADEDWHEAGSLNHANYTNLHPGQYIFRVQSRRAAGPWSPVTATLDITIAHPWWERAWARLLYVLLAAGLALLIYRLIVVRERSRLALEFERNEARQLQELDQFKSRFFANISHEFRTPLTLISGPLQRLLDGATDENRDTLLRMQRNARRLGRLIEQLLALSRLEAGRLPVNWERRDLVPFVRGLAANFLTPAKEREIDYEVEVPGTDLTVWFDIDLLDKILVNLLSNAFKFTPDGGRVRLAMHVLDDVEIVPVPQSSDSQEEPQTAAARSVRFELSNTGSYISPDQRDIIFDRYRQLEPGDASAGSGIGLALVSELVAMMAGQIVLESHPDTGTVFIVTLPFFVEAPVPQTETASPAEELEAAPPLTAPADADGGDRADARAPEQEDDATAPDRPQLLVVEDHADMRAFIKEELADDYDCLEAADGAKGLEVTLREIPDLVVSDVMMPGLDGFELCRRLKEDERTSHIPVILLTAKAEIESRVEGLAAGADAYLAKPFSSGELRARVANLIDQRKRLQELYTRRLVTLGPAAMPSASTDERFLSRAREIIEQHLDDPEFSVTGFARELGVSVTLLQRKLKALTDLTPLAFIRTHRLQRAAQFLESGYGNVTEVAYAVGLQSLSTFAKRFREQYGVLPSEYPPDREGGSR